MEDKIKMLEQALNEEKYLNKILLDMLKSLLDRKGEVK